MKFNSNYFSLILVCLLLIKISLCIKLSLTKGGGDDFQLDDKEIEAMLKDPKFANIAGDLTKLKSSRAQMAAAGAELKNLGVDVDKKGGNKDKAEKLDKAEDLKDLPKEDSPLPSFKPTLEKPKKPVGMENPEDLLAKLGGDTFKDLGMDALGKLPGIEAPSAAAPQKQEEPKAPIDDKFKNIEFLTKQQARLLLEILKQPSFFNLLPQEAQQIVKVKFINTFVYIVKHC